MEEQIPSFHFQTVICDTIPVYSHVNIKVIVCILIDVQWQPVEQEAISLISPEGRLYYCFQSL
jgi:hypothetical protein